MRARFGPDRYGCHTVAVAMWRVRDFHADDLDAVVRLWSRSARGLGPARRHGQGEGAHRAAGDLAAGTAAAGRTARPGAAPGDRAGIPALRRYAHPGHGGPGGRGRGRAETGDTGRPGTLVLSPGRAECLELGCRSGPAGALRRRELR